MYNKFRANNYFEKVDFGQVTWYCIINSLLLPISEGDENAYRYTEN